MIANRVVNGEMEELLQTIHDITEGSNQKCENSINNISNCITFKGI